MTADNKGNEMKEAKNNRFEIQDVNIFEYGDDGEFSADVRISQTVGEDFSIQFGTDGEWSFAPEVKYTGSLAGMIEENDKTGRPSDWVARKIAGMIGAVDAIERAKVVADIWPELAK